MTEAEWLAETYPFSLMNASLEQIEPRKVRLLGVEVEFRETIRTPLIVLTPRRSRLFATACCRRTSSRITPGCHDLLSEIEQQVDVGNEVVETHLHTKVNDELERLDADDRDDYRPGVVSAVGSVLLTASSDVSPSELVMNIANNLACSAGEVAHLGGEDRWPPEVEAAHEAEHAAQAVIFRDIFGNPFRPVTFNPAWRTSTAVLLAQQMYESRDFSTMPILADALQDAGCDNAIILSHCRDANATHVRGCWVVDIILGKS